MLFIAKNRLFNLPKVVLRNCKKYLAPYKGKKVILAPYGEYIVNLLYRNYFHDVEIVGFLDNDSKKVGKVFNGYKIFSNNDLSNLDIDAIIVANLRFGNEIYETLEPVAKERNIELINLCKNYDRTKFRHELAKSLDFRKLSSFRSDLYNLPKKIDAHTKIKIEITGEHFWGLGDHLCILSTAREVAKRNPNLEVYFNLLPDVVPLYKDNLIKTGPGAYCIPEHYTFFHREKDYSPAGNYLGCYYLGLGLDFDTNPNLDLPQIEHLEGLVPNKYIALQPSANWAQPNLSIEQLCFIIKSSNLPVVLTGPFTPVNTSGKLSEDENKKFMDKLKDAGANISYVGNIKNMLSIIKYAAYVLAPRSASAHIAAGYKTKSIIWIPNDGENWHLDYPEWEHTRIHANEDKIEKSIVNQMRILETTINTKDYK